MNTKFLDKIQEEARKYALDALSNPVDQTTFEYGSHHGVLKGLHLAEQWFKEMLEDEEDDENE